MDERLRRQLSALFLRLRQPIALLDGEGKDVLAGIGAETMAVPEALEPGKPLNVAGQTFMRSEAVDTLTWAVDARDEAEAADRLMMAEALLDELLKQNPDAAGPEYVYRRLLLGEADEFELSEALNAYGIARRLPRCVMLMEADAQWRGNFLQTMRTILPAGPTDALISVDRRTVAYLVDMSMVEERSDLVEYASAAQESALSESGCRVRTGIGGLASDLIGLPVSCRQARQALDVGRVFEPKQSVYDYQRLLMPRFLSEIPPEVAARYHYMLFNAETAKLFSEELLETVKMFFEKDLNLSDTARQLYIHRNTLTYRLDKIEKITGLDLRRFDDAVTFKMLLEMKKRIRE